MNATPPGPRQDPRQGGEEYLISGLEGGAVHLTPQHRELMPQHQDLDLFGRVSADAQQHHT
jgi:hypothetical protein